MYLIIVFYYTFTSVSCFPFSIIRILIPRYKIDRNKIVRLQLGLGFTVPDPTVKSNLEGVV